MQAGVFALVVVDVNGGVLSVDGLAIGRFDAFKVRRKNVVGFSSGNALSELAMMVGIDIPADFLGLVGGTANLDVDSVDGAIVGAPDRTSDQRVGLVVGLLSKEEARKKR